MHYTSRFSKVGEKIDLHNVENKYALRRNDFPPKKKKKGKVEIT